jgi:hypothetical protein
MCVCVGLSLQGPDNTQILTLRISLQNHYYLANFTFASSFLFPLGSEMKWNAWP